MRSFYPYRQQELPLPPELSEQKHGPNPTAVDPESPVCFESVWYQLPDPGLYLPVPWARRGSVHFSGADVDSHGVDGPALHTQNMLRIASGTLLDGA